MPPTFDLVGEPPMAERSIFSILKMRGRGKEKPAPKSIVSVLGDDAPDEFSVAERLGREPMTEAAVEAWKSELYDLLLLHLLDANPGLKKEELDELMLDQQQLFAFGDIVNSLAHNEFTPNPHLWLLSELLYEELVRLRLLPNEANVAVVPVGGAVHGGGALKVAFHLSVLGGEDLDIALVFDQAGLSQEQIDNIAQAADAFLQRRTGNRIKLCRQLNPTEFFAHNLHDVEQAKELLLSWQGLPEGWKFGDHLLLYFYPSIPAEINLRNRELLLSALAEISVTYPQKWDELIQKLFTAWGQVHTIKEKHLVKESIWHSQTERVVLAARIVSRAARVMGQPMLRLLESTK